MDSAPYEHLGAFIPLDHLHLFATLWLASLFLPTLLCGIPSFLILVVFATRSSDLDGDVVLLD